MDDLLKNTQSPRLILVGGSNISLSINSQMIKDSLKVNPINTGISVNIGLVYMLDNTLKYIKDGDIIVVSPEYSHFYDRKAYGGEDLVKVIFDINPKEVFNLRLQQLWNIVPFVPYYSFSKVRLSEYSFALDTAEIYGRNSFNQYGDNFRHWNLPQRSIRPLRPLTAEFDHFAIDRLYEFKIAAEKKGAIVYITFPALQETSFEIQKTAIDHVERELKQKEFTLLGNPERYIMPDSLMFDTPYHLIKSGVDLRTAMLIEDLKAALYE